MQFFKVVTMETEEDEFDDGSYSCFELLSLERNLESFYEGRLNHLDLWYHRPVKKTNKKKGNYFYSQDGSVKPIDVCGTFSE